MSYPYNNSYGAPPPHQGYQGGYPPGPPPPSSGPPYQQHPPAPQQPPYGQGQPPPQQQFPPPGAYQHHPPPGPYQHGPYPGQPMPAQNLPYPPPGPPGPYQYPPSDPYHSYGQAQQQPYPPVPPPGGSPGYAPPPQHIAPTAPSLGYDPDQRAPGDASMEADALRKAMKGFGTDEAALIDILSKPDPLQMALIRHTYTHRIGRNLEKDIEKETSGDLETILLALAGGPLNQDITHLHKAMAGMGTNEKAMNDVLIGRSNADLRAIKYAYVSKYQKPLVDAVKGDLSGKTEKFFVMLLNATRPENAAFFDQASVEADIREIHQGTQGKTGTDEIGVSAVFLNASDAKLCAIAQAFETRYHVSLEKVIKDEFSGHLEEALLALLIRARDPVKFDVEKLLTSCGPEKVDTKRLVYWVVHLHWNRPYFHTVKAYLQNRLGSDFSRYIRQFVSGGDFQNALLKVWEA